MKAARILMLWTLLVCIGCGGGTAGTGSGSGSVSGFEKVLRGQVTDEQGIGIPGASVVVLETGDSTVSELDGAFSLVTELPSSSASVEVTKDDRKAEQRIESLSPTTSVIKLDVELGTGIASSTISDFEFSVLAITGEGCAGAFAPAKVFSFAGNADPLVVIDQTAPVPANARCVVQVRAAAGSAPQAGVPFQIIQVRPSFVDSDAQVPQKIVGNGVTTEAGIGSADFLFAAGEVTGGYYLVEAPANGPIESRIGVVINPVLSF